MLWKSLDFGGESRQSPGRPIPWHPSHQATADSLHAYRGIRGTDRWHQTLQESASIPWITTLQSNSCSPVLSTGYTPPWTRAFPPVNDSLQVISAFRTWRLSSPPPSSNCIFILQDPVFLQTLTLKICGHLNLYFPCLLHKYILIDLFYSWNKTKFFLYVNPELHEVESFSKGN